MTGQRLSVGDEVAHRLRPQSQTEGLRPGDRLGREDDLSRRLGVNRPAVRDLMRESST